MDINWSAFMAITNMILVIVIIATIWFTNRNTNLQIKSITRRGYCDLLMRLTDKWFSPQMNDAKAKVLALEKIEGKYFLQNDDIPLRIAIQEIASFFENVGLQVDRGYIPFWDAFDLVGGHTAVYWDIYRVAILDLRKIRGSEGYFEWFEYFAKRCKAKLAETTKFTSIS